MRVKKISLSIEFGSRYWQHGLPSKKLSREQDRKTAGNGLERVHKFLEADASLPDNALKRARSKRFMNRNRHAQARLHKPDVGAGLMRHRKAEPFKRANRLGSGKITRQLHAERRIGSLTK